MQMRGNAPRGKEGHLLATNIDRAGGGLRIWHNISEMKVMTNITQEVNIYRATKGVPPSPMRVSWWYFDLTCLYLI
jgi:hypothetical protein